MPVYVEISPLHRLVTIVARGKLTAEEVRGAAERFADAQTRRFAKILEVADAYLDLAPADMLELARILRGDSDQRGPIAFVVAPGRGELARQYAALTAQEGPIEVFHKLHDARAWLAEIRESGLRSAPSGLAVAAAASDAWADPDRRGTMIRGARQREYTTRALVG